MTTQLIALNIYLVSAIVTLTMAEYGTKSFLKLGVIFSTPKMASEDMVKKLRPLCVLPVLNTLLLLMCVLLFINIVIVKLFFVVMEVYKIIATVIVAAALIIRHLLFDR